MTMHELIELAVLDAQGMLDPAEQAAFEAALASAPAVVREQVRIEQDRLCDIEHLLPEDMPRPELRELVVAAVRAAMRTESAAPSGVVARIGSQGVVNARAGLAPAQPTLRMAPRVHRLWRAAAIGLATATVGLVLFNLRTVQEQRQASRQLVINRLYDGVGATLIEDMLFDANTTARSFARTGVVSGEGSVVPASASVWHNPDWSSARLFVQNMRSEPGEKFRLVVLNEQGQIVREVAEFVGTGRLEDFSVPADAVVGEDKLGIERVGGNDAELVLIATEA
jgi:hypothetical protein